MEAAQRGIPFIAAGRNAARLQAEMAKIPELEGHDWPVRGVAYDRASLIEIAAWQKLVLNIVGPFMQLRAGGTGRPGRRATTLTPRVKPTGCFSFLQKEYGAAFERKELALTGRCTAASDRVLNSHYPSST